MKWILAVSLLLAAGVAAKTSPEEGEDQHHLRNNIPGQRRLQGDCDPTVDPVCDCMGDKAIETGLLKRNPSDFGCTSNDVRVAETNVLSVDGSTDEPFTCIEGDLINVELAVSLVNGASSRRSDIGLWLSQDGGDAETGDCIHVYFPDPPGDGLMNIDDNPVDTCGDLAGQEAPPAIDLDPFILTCSDEGGVMGGMVNIGSCIGWKVPGADENCDEVAAAAGPPDDYAAATLPATKSKCRCEVLVLDITILRPPEITKTCSDGILSMDQDTVLFNFVVTITNNAEQIDTWSAPDFPIEFDTPLNQDNNGPLAPGVNVFNPQITLSVADAVSVDVDTVTLMTADYDDVTATADCPDYTFEPAVLEATINCDDQGTEADGTQFIVTQTFSGSVCNTGGTNAEEVVVNVMDGNGASLFTDTVAKLAAGACITFDDRPGSVTADFTGTCDATFSAMVTSSGKNIAGDFLATSTTTADCPVCDCP